MSSLRLVEGIRAALGPIGASLPASFTQLPAISEQRSLVRQLEEAGYRAVWLNETVGGKDVLVQAALLLAATDHLVVGTSIANVWARPAVTAHAAAAQLAEAYPGRFVLGIGVGFAAQATLVGREYGPPLATARAYLAAMDTPTAPIAPTAYYARVLGANGPRMMAVAAELADGAMPAMQSAAFTADARRVLGPDKLLVVLVEAPREPAAAAGLAREHLDAGADHVIAGSSLGSEFAAGVQRLLAIGPDLTAVG